MTRRESIDPALAASDDETEQPKKQGRSLATRAALGIGGLTLAGGILTGCGHTDAKDVGFTPTPAVSPGGTEMLIKANDFIVDYGAYGLALGAAGGLAYGATRRIRPDGKLNYMHKITHPNRRVVFSTFAGLAMGISATSLGLGDTAANAAAQPITAAENMVGAHDSTLVVNDYDGSPGNYMSVNLPVVEQAVTDMGGTPVPYMQDLGKVTNPHSDVNPSSAPILALPNAAIEKSFGVSLPAVEDCNDIKVIVGEQLGVGVGDDVMVNGRHATVAKTVPMKPGLDRVAEIGSLEQYKCIAPEKPMTGVIALGLDNRKAELLGRIHDKLGVDYAARTFGELRDENQRFWNKSVKPLEMNLILDILLLGGGALAAIQINEVISARKEIAMDLSQGVTKRTWAGANALGTQRDTLVATGTMAASNTVFTMMNNSSQFGVAEKVNLAVEGGAYSVLALVGLAVAGVSAVAIKRFSANEELRST